MSKEIRDSSEEAMYFGGLMEDMNDKFQAILESTKDIPLMNQKIDHILKWEEKINLIPAMFEEVGELRKDVEVLKDAMKLLGRSDERVNQLEQRIAALEQKTRA